MRANAQYGSTCSGVVLLGLTMGVMACAYRGVPAPAFTTPFDKVSPDSIRDYVKLLLRFDEREGAGDRQPLIVGCPAACRIGPEVSIQPEKRTHRNSVASLAEGPGRIIARIINHDAKEGYPPLNLGPGDTVYWAVDQVKPVRDTVSVGRSLYITARGLRGETKTVVLPKRVYVRDHPHQESWKQALARWIPVDSTYEDSTDIHYEAPGGGAAELLLYRALATWGNCRSNSCCGP
jgi:hypothetical protein